MPSIINYEELIEIVSYCDHTRSSNPPCFIFKLNEYSMFTQLIQDHWDSIPGQHRWQVILSGGHHCLFDFKKDGSSLEVIAIDPHDVNVYALAKTTHQLLSKSGKFTLKMIGISTYTQSDTRSCAIFAIEHARAMAAIDLHSLLAREFSQANTLADQQTAQGNITTFFLLEKKEEATPTAFALAHPEISARLLKYVQNYHVINTVREQSTYSAILNQKIDQIDTLESYWVKVCVSSNSQTSQAASVDSKEEKPKRVALKLRNNAIDIELQAIRTAVAENARLANNPVIINLQDFSRLIPLQDREMFYVNDLVGKGLIDAQAIAALSPTQKHRLDLLKTPFVYFLATTKQITLADFQDDDRFRLFQKLLNILVIKGYHHYFYGATAALNYSTILAVYQRGKLEYLLNHYVLFLINEKKLTATDILTLSPAHLWLLGGNLGAVDVVKKLSENDAEVLGEMILQDENAKTFISKGLKFFGADFVSMAKLMVSRPECAEYKRLVPEIIGSLILYSEAIQLCQKDSTFHTLTDVINHNITAYEAEKRFFSLLIHSSATHIADLQFFSDHICKNSNNLFKMLWEVQTGVIEITTPAPTASSSSSVAASIAPSSGGYTPRMFAPAQSPSAAKDSQPEPLSPHI